MPEITSPWWPDERVDATVSRDYILRTLHPTFHPRLNYYLSFGEKLTDDTYLDWILARARKLYLILLELSVPDRIFYLIDYGYDDADLPITSENTASLRLSPVVKDVLSDFRFAGVQRRFLVRTIHQGKHVKYREEESIPVEAQNEEKLPISFPDSVRVDKVVHAGTACQGLLRLKVTLGEAPYYLDEEDVLREVKALRPCAHEHVFSVFGSYSVGRTVNVLLSGAPECTLKSFLNDRSSSFKRLPKDQQQLVLLNWPHCLASGLAWLHGRGQHHGAIRPSNILIDSENRIFLGAFDLFDPLIPHRQPNDIESYQYAAPEQKSNTLPSLPSPYSPSRPTTAKRDATQTHNLAAYLPLSPTAGFFARSPPSLPKRRSRVSLQRSVSSSSGTSSSHSSITRRNIPSFTSQSTMSMSPSSHVYSAIPKSAPTSAASNHLNSSNNDNNNTRKDGGKGGGNKVRAVPSNRRYDLASDVFCLAAISVDILTCFCKKKQSAFVNHRSAKNRTPGYGGNIPDASFHLARNAEQIFSWMDILKREASKHKNPYYRGVAPLLAVARDMFSRNPETRPSAVQVVARYAQAICSVANDFEPHCRFDPEALLAHRDNGDNHDSNSFDNRHNSCSSLSSGAISSFPLTPDPVTESHQERIPLTTLHSDLSRAPSSCYSFGNENEPVIRPVLQDQNQQRNLKPKPFKPLTLDLDIIDDEEIGLGIDLDAGVAKPGTYAPSIPPRAETPPPSPPPKPTLSPWSSLSNLSNPNLPTLPDAKPQNKPLPKHHLIPAPLSIFPPSPAPAPKFSPPPIPDFPSPPISTPARHPLRRSVAPNRSGIRRTRRELQKFPQPPMSSPWKESDIEQLQSSSTPLNSQDAFTHSENRRAYTNFSRQYRL
ncbi:hypothetical protein PRK78_000417 [Emydomyces testavorans]|uniref:Protein kinase domain-containing protein n=1 Tax=Emydomyces testavorans TaxID=2070801 RepID=A0AAF0DB50_9EURO|nr:hypothetical protein PRK78_000417 [Emydomyces testavorans]